MFRAQKLEALEQLAGGLAHDFNNVLSIIDGYARLIGGRLEAGSDEMNYLERIRMASARGSGLVRKMLMFSRHRIEKADVIDLSEVLREQEAMLAPFLDHSVQLILRMEGDDFYVRCTPEAVMQILLNLVSNARDAMPCGGVVFVEARRCAAAFVPASVRGMEAGGRDCVRLSVTDTGEGMSEDILERIFDPFFTTKEYGKGVGLGLSVVYGLAKQAGGGVDVVSAPRRGTTVAVYLPIADEKPSKIIRGTPEDSASMRLEGYTGLVVDDERDISMLVGEMLEKMGMKVLRACGGDEALALQDDLDGPVDILITDVVMPDLGGVELASLLEALHPEMRTIFMSGYPLGSPDAKFNLPKHACFMAKPVEYDVMARLVYQSLREHKYAALEEEYMKIARWRSWNGIEGNPDLGTGGAE